jgi:hypothetical protein
MRESDFFTTCQICDYVSLNSGHYDKSVRKIDFYHRHPHQALTFILWFAKLAYLPDAHSA